MTEIALAASDKEHIVVKQQQQHTAADDDKEASPESLESAEVDATDHESQWSYEQATSKHCESEEEEDAPR